MTVTKKAQALEKITLVCMSCDIWTPIQPEFEQQINKISNFISKWELERLRSFSFYTDWFTFAFPPLIK